MELNSILFPCPTLNWKASDYYGKILFIPHIHRNPSVHDPPNEVSAKSTMATCIPKMRIQSKMNTFGERQSNASWSSYSATGANNRQLHRVDLNPVTGPHTKLSLPARPNVCMNNENDSVSDVHQWTDFSLNQMY